MFYSNSLPIPQHGMYSPCPHLTHFSFSSDAAPPLYSGLLAVYLCLWFSGPCFLGMHLHSPQMVSLIFQSCINTPIVSRLSGVVVSILLSVQEVQGSIPGLTSHHKHYSVDININLRYVKQLVYVFYRWPFVSFPWFCVPLANQSEFYVKN